MCNLKPLWFMRFHFFRSFPHFFLLFSHWIWFNIQLFNFIIIAFSQHLSVVDSKNARLYVVNSSCWKIKKSCIRLLSDINIHIHAYTIYIDWFVVWAFVEKKGSNGMYKMSHHTHIKCRKMFNKLVICCVWRGWRIRYGCFFPNVSELIFHLNIFFDIAWISGANDESKRKKNRFSIFPVRNKKNLYQERWKRIKLNCTNTFSLIYETIFEMFEFKWGALVMVSHFVVIQQEQWWRANQVKTEEEKSPFYKIKSNFRKTNGKQ